MFNAPKHARLLSAALVAALAAGTGCATTKAPQAQLTSSHSSIRAAEELHAAEVPKANLHLQMAKENVERAEKLMNSGDNEEACYVLMRAQSDAELALALAKEFRLQKDSQDALDKVQKLQGQATPATTPAP